MAMFSFSFAMSIAPGPVNIMIISSGANYGFRKTFAFISGATIGFTVLLIIIALGLSSIIGLYPNLFRFLEVLGVMIILYIAYKIITANGRLSIEKKEQKQLTFFEGFLLQWLNPKAWIGSVSGISMFPIQPWSLTVFIIMYFIVCYVSLSFWGVVGQKVSIFLNTNKRLKIFNGVMGGFLIFTALSVLLM
jgi:threonine/homoserine/homoserine lactone efflux protein